MIFGPNISYFNELEINGEHVDDGDNEDFTRNQPESEDTDDTMDDAVDEGEDDLADFTEDEFVDEDDIETNEDVDTTEEDQSEEDTDYTEDEFVDEDDIEDEENVNDEEPTEDSESDNEADAANDTGEDNTADGEAEDDLTDFTQDEFDGSDDSEGDTNEEGSESEEGTDNKSKDSENDNASDNKGDGNTLADMEKNLFADLSPQQLAIKNNELLQNYIELYETVNSIFDSVNKIPKTIDNTRPLTFIADQLVELKDMVNYIITTTYVTRTYVENMTYYKQALVILQQLNTMLKALIQKTTK